MSGISLQIFREKRCFHLHGTSVRWMGGGWQGGPRPDPWVNREEWEQLQTSQRPPTSPTFSLSTAGWHRHYCSHSALYWTNILHTALTPSLCSGPSPPSNHIISCTLSLLLYPEDGGSKFFRNVVTTDQTTWYTSSLGNPKLKYYSRGKLLWLRWYFSIHLSAS
jgi:hypothetical protein